MKFKINEVVTRYSSIQGFPGYIVDVHHYKDSEFSFTIGHTGTQVRCGLNKEIYIDGKDQEYLNLAKAIAREHWNLGVF